MQLENKVALITGAGSGIGRQTAQLFAAEGARVVVVDVDEAAGRQTVESLGAEQAMYVPYTASKGGVLAMTRELAVIHARQNIRVNALCPGPLRTELLMKYLDTEEKRQRRLVHIPMGRFGEAEEIARSVLFLASDASSFVTGTTFLVDGGITAAYVTPE